MSVQVQRPNGVAPSLSTYRMGGKGGAGARAWQWVWDHLDKNDFKDATVLAREAAKKYGLKPETVLDNLYRMARDGVLQYKLQSVLTEVNRGGQTIEAYRARRHYRIAP